VVPGTVNVEAIAINKDHVNMAKFESSRDGDFETICGLLDSMIIKAPQKVSENWIKYKKYEGG